ncbi:MAG: hypothetical protein SFU98_20455 [Leptospiraceae bacterium]|nr:hypothetical protein [Leptospiraceae bacterium]
MNWKRIPKENSVQPSTGTYSDWKGHLAKEGFHQCVYCTIKESSFGGIRNFHVEHYKPKGKADFKSLTNIFTNLFYACSICNSFKSDDFPLNPTEDLNIPSYPDPSKYDYSNFIGIDFSTMEAFGENAASNYMIYKLFLNRPQLLQLRKEYLYYNKTQEIATEAQRIIGELKENSGHYPELSQLILELTDISLRMIQLFIQYNDVIPYSRHDTQR